MSHANRGASPLVYLQDDAFVAAVGEPMPLKNVRRIVIAKWDGLYAEGLRAACSRAFPDTRAEVCRQGNDLLNSLRASPADFVLQGLTFVDVDGIDILQTIARERLARRVMVVTSRKDEHSLQALRTAHFDGFFDPFEETVDGLVDALRQVAGGHGYISASLRRQMLEQRSTGVLVPRLTPAELQVFCVIGDGSDDREAAERLGISVATVQTHRKNIMRKLDITSSAKLVREAVRLGVVRIKNDGEVLRPGFSQLHSEWQTRKARSLPLPRV